jgi:NAD+ synthase (glutamine-hydrolysing)
MIKTLRIALAQLNFTVGDIEGNLQKHIEAALHARDQLKADIIVFPELSLTGYPPEDLLFRKNFIDSVYQALDQFAEKTSGIYGLIGHPLIHTHGLQNACSLFYNGTLMGRYAKQCLPNYGVFDEKRYFIPGNSHCVVSVHGVPVGLVVCEDLWSPAPARQAVAHGARLILSPNASPFEADKHERRAAILIKRAEENHVPIVYVNHVSGQDELVFDGDSMIIDEHGKKAQHAGLFVEKIHLAEIRVSTTHAEVPAVEVNIPTKAQRMYDALVLGLRDYVEKNHFCGVVLGLSGGIDSALALAIAVDALGKDRVHAILMPSRYTTDISNVDAETIAKNFNVTYDTISIEPAFQAFLDSLSPVFKDKKADVTEENIQARCRAILLMAFSNKTGKLVLTTGNRSELAVGYCTLYGDMAGGFAVLKDLFKTQVYELANYRNSVSPMIPQRIIERAPSAELAPNQKDEDTLPPYSILDQILDAYLNHNESAKDIIAKGFDPATVTRVIKLIKHNEYKRRQAAVGTHLNHKSFGKDWRYPITNGFKE